MDVGKLRLELIERRRSLAAERAPGKAALVAEWLRAEGVAWDDADMVVAESATQGVFVRAARDLGEGEAVCRIPKTCVLSYATADEAVREVLDKYEVGEGLALTVLVMHERARGQASRWHGYLAAMDKPDVVMFWADAEDTLGSDAEPVKRALSDLEAMAEDYEANVAPMLKSKTGRRVFPKRGMAFADFVDAAVLVGSRAFTVDGLYSMVPMADLLNHTVEENARIVGAEYDDDDDDGGDDGEEDEEDEDEDEEKEKDSADDTDHLAVRIVENIPAKGEIFNTYGRLSNTELVCKYGFALPDNTNDVVIVSLATVCRLVDPEGAMRAQALALQAFYHASIEDEEDLDIDHSTVSDQVLFLITHAGDISYGLVLVLQLLDKPPGTLPDIDSLEADWEDVVGEIPAAIHAPLRTLLAGLLGENPPRGDGRPAAKHLVAGLRHCLEAARQKTDP